MADDKSYDLDDFEGGRTDDSMDFDMDMEFNLEEKPDDRTPMSQAISGVREGVTDFATSPEDIAEFVKSTLPSEMDSEVGGIINEVGNAKRELGEAVAQIKPEIESIVGNVKKMVPEGKMRSLVERMEKSLGLNQKTQEEERVSADEQHSQATADKLDALFNTQSKHATRRDITRSMDQQVDRTINITHHTALINSLKAIHAAVADNTKYNTTITSKYQRRSLELKYKQVYIAKGTLEEITKTNKLRNEQLETVIRNTALPEYNKMQISERMAEKTRDDLIDAGKDAIFGDGGILGDRVRNIKKWAKLKLEDVKESISNTSGMLDQLVGAMDQMDGMSEPGASKIQSKVAMATGAVIGPIIKWLASTVTGGAIEENQAYAAILSKLKAAGRKMPRQLDAKIQKAIGGGDTHALANGLRSAMQIVQEGLNYRESVNDQIFGGDDKIPGIDGRFYNTVTDVIPGYLARVVQELQMQRIGGTPELIQFDHNKNTFTTQTGINTSIIKHIKAQTPSDSINSAVDDIMDIGEERGGELSPKDHAKVRSLILTALAESYTGVSGGQRNFHDFRNSSAVEKAIENDDALGDIIELFASEGEGHVDYNKGGDAFSKLIETSKEFEIAKESSELISKYGLRHLMEAGVVTLNPESNEVEISNHTLAAIFAGDMEEIAVSKADRMRAGGVNSLNTYNTMLERTDNTDKDGEYITSPDGTTNSLTGSSSNTYNIDIEPIHETLKVFSDSNDAGLMLIAELLENSNTTVTVDSVTQEEFTVVDGVASVHDAENLRMLTQMDDHLGDLGVNIVDISNTFETVGDRLTTMTETVGARLAEAGKALKGLGDLEHIQGFVDRINSMSLEEVRGAVNSTYHSASNAVTDRIDQSGIMEMPFGKVIGSGFDTAWRGIQAVTFGGVLMASSAADKAKGFFSDAAQNNDGTVGGKVRTAAESAKEGLQGIFTSSLGLAGTVIGGVQRLAGNAMSALPDSWAKIVQGFSWMKDKLSTYWNSASVLDRPMDIYVEGLPDPVLLKIVMSAGGYFDRISGDTITLPKDIKGEVVDSEGNIVLTTEMLSGGIYDSHGNDLSSFFGKLKGALGINKFDIIGRLSKAGQWIKGRIVTVGSFVSSLWSSITGWNIGSTKNMDKMLELQTSQLTTQLSILDVIKTRYGGTKFNDRDGDGVRDGSFKNMDMTSSGGGEAKFDATVTNHSNNLGKIAGVVGGVLSTIGGGIMSALGVAGASAVAGSMIGRSIRNANNDTSSRRSGLFRRRGASSGVGSVGIPPLASRGVAGPGVSVLDGVGVVSDLFGLSRSETDDLSRSRQTADVDRRREELREIARDARVRETQRDYLSFRDNGYSDADAKHMANTSAAKRYDRRIHNIDTKDPEHRKNKTMVRDISKDVSKGYRNPTNYRSRATSAISRASRASETMRENITSRARSTRDSASSHATSGAAFIASLMGSGISSTDAIKLSSARNVSRNISNRTNLDKALDALDIAESAMDAKSLMDGGLSPDEARRQAEASQRDRRARRTRILDRANGRDTMAVRRMFRRANRSLDEASNPSRQRLSRLQRFGRSGRGEFRDAVGGGRRMFSGGRRTDSNLIRRGVGAGARGIGAVGSAGARGIGAVGSAGARGIGALGRGTVGLGRGAIAGAIGAGNLLTGLAGHATGALLPLVANPVVGGILLAVAAVAAAGTAVAYRKEIIEGFGKFVDWADDTIIDGGAWIERQWIKGKKWATESVATLGDGIAKVMKWTSDKASSAWDWTTEKADAFVEGTGKAYDSVVDGANQIFGSMAGWVTGAVAELGTAETQDKNTPWHVKLGETLADGMINSKAIALNRMREIDDNSYRDYDGYYSVDSKGKKTKVSRWALPFISHTKKDKDGNVSSYLNSTGDLVTSNEVVKYNESLKGMTKEQQRSSTGSDIGRFNRFSAMTQLRMKLYGMYTSMGTQSPFYSYIPKLENMVIAQGAVTVVRGKVVIDNSKIKSVEIRELFDVSNVSISRGEAGELGEGNNLITWLLDRFLPVFVMALQAAVDSSIPASVKDIDAIRGSRGNAYVDNFYLAVLKDLAEGRTIRMVPSPFAAIYSDITKRVILLPVPKKEKVTQWFRILTTELIIGSLANIDKHDRNNYDVSATQPNKDLIAELDVIAKSIIGVGMGPEERKVRAKANKKIVTLKDEKDAIDNRANLAKELEAAILKDNTAKKSVRDKLTKAQASAPVYAQGEVDVSGALSNACNWRDFASNPNSIQGLQVKFHDHICTMAAEFTRITGEIITVLGAYRTHHEQDEQYKSGHAKEPSGVSAFPLGLAVNISSSQCKLLDKLGLLSKYGLTRPVGGDPSVVEPQVIQMKFNQYQTHPENIKGTLHESYRRAGGGWGAPNSGYEADSAHTRNAPYQAVISKMPQTAVDPYKVLAKGMGAPVSASEAVSTIEGVDPNDTLSKKAKDSRAKQKKKDDKERRLGIARAIMDQANVQVPEDRKHMTLAQRMLLTKLEVKHQTLLGLLDLSGKIPMLAQKQALATLEQEISSVLAGATTSKAQDMDVYKIANATNTNEVMAAIKPTTSDMYKEIPTPINTPAPDLNKDAAPRAVVEAMAGHKVIKEQTARLEGLETLVKSNVLPEEAKENIRKEIQITKDKIKVAATPSPYQPYRPTTPSSAQTEPMSTEPVYNPYTDTGSVTDGGVSNIYAPPTGKEAATLPTDTSYDIGDTNTTPPRAAMLALSKHAAGITGNTKYNPGYNQAYIAESRKKIFAGIDRTKWSDARKKKAKATVVAWDKEAQRQKIPIYIARSILAQETSMATDTNYREKGAQGPGQMYGPAWTDTEAKFARQGFSKGKAGDRLRDHGGARHIRNGLGFAEIAGGYAGMSPEDMKRLGVMGYYLPHHQGGGGMSKFLKAEKRGYKGRIGDTDIFSKQAMRENGSILNPNNTLADVRREYAKHFAKRGVEYGISSTREEYIKRQNAFLKANGITDSADPKKIAKAMKKIDVATTKDVLTIQAKANPQLETDRIKQMMTTALKQDDLTDVQRKAYQTELDRVNNVTGNDVDPSTNTANLIASGITRGRRVSVDLSKHMSIPSEFNSKSVHTAVASPAGGDPYNPTGVPNSKIAVTEVTDHAEPVVDEHIVSIDSVLSKSYDKQSEIVTVLKQVISAINESGATETGTQNPTNNGLHTEEPYVPVKTKRKNTLAQNEMPEPGFNVLNRN